jgi:porin
MTKGGGVFGAVVGVLGFCGIAAGQAPARPESAQIEPARPEPVEERPDAAAGAIGDAPEAESDEEYKSGYGEPRYFGGPQSVGGELQEADRVKKPAVRVEALDALFEPWFDLKKRVKRDIGLSFGAKYTGIYQGATESLGEDRAASGVFQLQAQWALLGRDSTHPGSVVFQLWNRHELWTDITPAELGSEIGSVVPTTFGFADTGWGIPQLHWQQLWKDGEIALLVGQLQPIAYLDTHPFVSPLTGFFNQYFSYNPTIAIPSSGLGVAGGAMLTRNLYFAGSLSDANGSTNQAGFDTFFGDREYFKHLELGWTPSFDDRKKDNVHLTLWHADERRNADVPEGYGLTTSMHTMIEDTWQPFLRAGYASGDAAPLQAMLSAGMGYYFREKNDLLAVGAGWGLPKTSRSLRTWQMFWAAL